MIPARLLAFNRAPEDIFSAGQANLKRHFSKFDFDFSSKKPFLLFFLSGGSERFALESVTGDIFYLLLASEENNSLAAATEVKAWMRQHEMDCLLADINEEDDRKKVVKYLEVKSALDGLIGKKLGLVGEVSDWLVASDVRSELLTTRFGINLEKICWGSVKDYKTFESDQAFTEKYPYKNKEAIVEAAKVHQALQKVIKDRQLNALTVECFSLVQKESVTACLSLSDLNDQGIPAGCEGDLTSITGMMLIQAVTGVIPWMANLVKVGTHRVKFAHCTAPTNLLETFDIDTHYETGKGTAVAGKFKGKTVTVLRLDNNLDQGFLATGQITSTHQSPEYACRTMIELELTSDKINQLKNHPLGNHHLIFPGNHCELLEMAFRMKGIRLMG